MSAEEKIERSASALRDVVWPAVKEHLGGGDLIPVETVRQSDFARVLDTLGGIDAWQQTPKWIRGVASRVQFGDRDWATHTVRCRIGSGGETELHKRLRHSRNPGVVGPHLTMQAYVDDRTPPGVLLSVGVVRTRDLIDVVMDHRVGEWQWPGWERGRPVYTRSNGEDRNLFVAVEWSVLEPLEHFLVVRPQAETRRAA